MLGGGGGGDNGRMEGNKRGIEANERSMEE